VRHPARALRDRITANRERMAQTVRESIGLVTRAQSPNIGYSAASEVAREALATGRTVYRIWFWKKNCSRRKQLDEILRPGNS